MSEFNQNGSGIPGSPIADSVPGGNIFAPQMPGQTQPSGETVPKSMYDALESKIGQMGNEVGEYRKFFDDISPLLEKLDKNPELAQAVLYERFDSDLAKAILENRVDVKQAQVIEQAHQEVKEELGNKGYTAATPDEVAKMVEEKVRQATEGLRQELESREDLRSFESRVNEFISGTSDFPEYADQISTWLEDHPDVVDVETAYYAVKGKLSESQARRQAEINQTEAAKDVAMNAAGGGNRATHITRNEPLIDQLISRRSDPNNFG